MNKLSGSRQRRVSKEKLLEALLPIGAIATAVPLALYGYLGTFSRYGSDDYCISAFYLQKNLVNAMIQRYMTATSRYTNIIFTGLADKLFGWYNVAILPALMLTLFVWGLYLLLKEIAGMLRFEWSRWMILLLALWVVYFSVAQAPNLYETLYWRAGMTSHFAPLVFIPFFGAFLLRQIQKTHDHPPSFWMQVACFIIPLVIGGLSEPPTALMITVLILATVAAAWWRREARYRRSVLSLLIPSLLGALIALIIMAAAPANALRTQTATPGLMELISRIIYYPLFFIVDTLRAYPIPTLASIIVPALLFYVKYSYGAWDLSQAARNRLGILMIVILLLTYLFIAAGFAPSAYGQSYPVPRARFIGRVLMTTALITEGALLGVLFSQIKSNFFQSTTFQGVATLVLIVLMLYPLRTAWRMAGEIPVYRERAAAWDAREVEIKAMKAAGQTDLVVRFLSKERLQDLGDHNGFRLNRCAAALYGVNTIVAVPMHDK